MKIKLVILEKDQNYLSRIISVLNTKFSDRFEVYSFTDLDMAMANLDSSRIEVFLAHEAFEVDVKKIPNRCGFAYLVDDAGVETFNGQSTIGKFQKVDLICKQILSIYSDVSSKITGIQLGDDHCKVVAFSSVSGGAGASSLAAGFAVRKASQGYRVLYLNLEKFGSSDNFFAGEGHADMSDIIFSLKTKKANLSLKLESCIKQDPRGVFFYSQTKVALDMLELNTEEMLRLVSESKLAGGYDYIVVDLDFSLSPDALELYRQMERIIWVGDGSEISNTKVFRAFEALQILENGKDNTVLNRVALIYNRFSNKVSKAIEGIDLFNIGGAPKYEHADSETVMMQLSKLAMLDKIC